MKCPVCNAQIADQSKFCVHCGSKIEVEKEAEPAQAIVYCKSCGTQLKPGTKFCPKCGSKQEGKAGVASSASGQGAGEKQDAEARVEKPAAQGAGIDLKKPSAQGAGSDQKKPSAQGAGDDQRKPSSQVAGNDRQRTSAQRGGDISVAATSAVPGTQQGNNDGNPGKKGGNGKLAVIAVVVLALLGAGALFGVRWVNTDHGPVDSETSTVQGNTEEEKKQESGADTESEPQSGESAGVEEKYVFQTADELAEKAQDELNDEEYIDAHKDSKKALQSYLRIAEKNDLKQEAQTRIEDCYEVYVEAIIAYGNVLEGQQDHLAATRYDAIKDMTDPARKLTEEIKSSGYSIDSDELEEYSGGLAGRYKDFYIRTINGFADPEQTGTPWPRDDAWKYASSAYSIQENGKGVLFGEDDLDDPLRLRYEFCLAWITTKRCEQGIKDDSLDAAGAAEKIRSILQETDYNPLLLQTYVGYAKQAGIGDVDKYQRAYDLIVNKVKEEQGLTIDANATGMYTGNKIDLRYFHYFNDLDGEEEYLVDDTNGTTAATRAWIRENIPDVLE